MNKTLFCAKLDYMTVKPYFTLKTALLFLFVFSFIGYGTGEPATMIGMCMMYSVIFSCYPFSVGERCGLDLLYGTLPITKKNIVAGRYAFTLFLNVFMLTLALTVASILMLLLESPFNWTDMLLSALVCIVFFSLIEAIQLPIYFKFGYTKAKFLTYLPLLCFPAVVFIASSLLGEDRLIPVIENTIAWVMNHTVAVCVFVLIMWAVLMLFSVFLSLRFYQKRES